MRRSATWTSAIHFNAYEDTTKPMGTECLYVTKEDLAAEVAASISHASGFINRGPKKRTDLFFLNNTEEPAILIEVCFVDSTADAELYDRSFLAICGAIVQAITGKDIETEPPVMPPPGDLTVPVVTISVDPPGSAKIVIKGGA